MHRREPLPDHRNDVRNMVEPDNYIEIYVNTPLEVYEVRDVTGMYAKASRGSSRTSNARTTVEYLCERGFLRM